MSLEEKFNTVRSVGEECTEEDELRNLLANKPDGAICYDGFEPSGRMHIAEGIMKMLAVEKLTSAGLKVIIWVADWFALLNNKLGGDMKKIEVVGHYFIEIWKAIGMDTAGPGRKVEFLWASKEINAQPDKYWPTVMEIARVNAVARVKRCVKRIDRNEEDELCVSQLLYVCMQCADIYLLKADICQLGMDQREVNLLAREYCDSSKREDKPIILSHHMLPGLQQGQEKMSKSDPSSCVFMDDEEAEVNVKIKKAYCPPKIVEGNPCLEYIKHLVFPKFRKFNVERSEANGGNKIFKEYDELIAEYARGGLHPADLKPALAKALNEMLQPVRDHFSKDAKAKDLLKRVKAFGISSGGKKPVKGNQKSTPVIAPKKDAIDMHASDSRSEVTLSSSNNVDTISLDERFRIVRSVGEECIQEDELRNLLLKKREAICYDGFEPSGRMHIAQGVMKTIAVNKLTLAGLRVKIWIADWFALLNNKMGGDLEKIEIVGRYLIEIWKAVGMKLEGQVDFLWSSKEINSRASQYWPIVMDIARKNNVSRIKRCVQIMGRSEEDDLTVAQMLYPCMQCADIFFLEADICQLGMDQRKVNVLAREYCDDIKRKNKPIILSHHMLPGLKQGQEKMSKSDPSSSVFMEDEEAEVNGKIMQAYCPPMIVEGNPCLEYMKYIVFPWFSKFEENFEVERSEANGGNKKFKEYDELIADYVSGKLDPADLRPALAKALNKILQPVRDHFATDINAKDLLRQVRAFRVTR